MMYSYKDSFQLGLSSLGGQRRIFEAFVRSVLVEVGEEISGMLAREVVFQWQGNVLGAYCPYTGEGRYFATLSLTDGHSEDGRWEPVLCLDLAVDRRWKITSRNHVEDAFSGMLAYPSVAKMLSELGGLQTNDPSKCADLDTSSPGEG